MTATTLTGFSASNSLAGDVELLPGVVEGLWVVLDAVLDAVLVEAVVDVVDVDIVGGGRGVVDVVIGAGEVVDVVLKACGVVGDVVGVEGDGVDVDDGVDVGDVVGVEGDGVDVGDDGVDVGDDGVDVEGGGEDEVEIAVHFQVDGIVVVDGVLAVVGRAGVDPPVVVHPAVVVVVVAATVVLITGADVVVVVVVVVVVDVADVTTSSANSARTMSLTLSSNCRSFAVAAHRWRQPPSNPQF